MLRNPHGCVEGQEWDAAGRPACNQTTQGSSGPPGLLPCSKALLTSCRRASCFAGKEKKRRRRRPRSLRPPRRGAQRSLPSRRPGQQRLPPTCQKALQPSQARFGVHGRQLLVQLQDFGEEAGLGLRIAARRQLDSAQLQLGGSRGRGSGWAPPPPIPPPRPVPPPYQVEAAAERAAEGAVSQVDQGGVLLREAALGLQGTEGVTAPARPVAGSSSPAPASRSPYRLPPAVGG